jgi:peptide/nickel transport system substrate-binding protein
MKRPNRIITLLVAVSVLLAACTSAATPTATTAPEATHAPPTPTPVPPTPTPFGPQVGGKYVIAVAGDPTTMDTHKSFGGSQNWVWWNIGASLIIQDPDTGELVPYLAESWKVAEDGLSYEFTLRKDVKFHDGAPLTAEDYVFTFQRLLDPETKAGTAGLNMTGAAGVELVDDYTFRITMAMPNAVFEQALTNIVFFTPYPKAYFEKVGEEGFAKHPISVGPFKFKEYVTGDKIVLERNPDFAWGPAFAHDGAPYLETIELRIVAEQATTVAGLESGDIDEASILNFTDVDRIEQSGQFTVYQYLYKGSGAEIDFNNSQPPFDDERVRQAFAYAVDKEAILKVVLAGRGEVQYGPISSSTMGYAPEVESASYPHDLDKAKARLEEAGYTYGADGMAQKDGQPFTLEMLAIANTNGGKTAQVLQQQLKALGVDVTISELERGIHEQRVTSGDYNIAVVDFGWDNYSVLWAFYNSRTIGALNWTRTNDPDLDNFLNGMVFTADPNVIEGARVAAQVRIVEKAYSVPLYTPYRYYAVSNRIEGEVFMSRYTYIWLADAYAP